MITKIYTPKIIAKDLILKSKEQYKEGFRILEPSCGDGNLIVGLVDELLKEGFRPYDLSQNIYINDTDREAVQSTEKRLVDVFKSHGYLLPDNSIHTSYSDVFTEKIFDGKRMDIIISNPPYGRFNKLDKDYQNKIRQIHEDIIFGNFDIYILAITLSLQQLSGDGFMACVIPDRWITSKNGTNLRKLLLDGFNIEIYKNELYSFRRVQVYPIIVTFKETDSNKETITSYIDNRKIASLPISSLDPESWDIYKKNSEIDRKLMKLSRLEIKGGITTLSNSVFYLTNVSIDHKKKLVTMEDGTKIELGATRPLYKKGLVGKSVVIFPYKEGTSKAKYDPLTESELKVTYPLAYKYLLKNRDKIENKKKRTISHPFYLWGRTQNMYNRYDKIILPIIVKDVKCQVLRDDDALIADMISINVDVLSDSGIATLVELLEGKLFKSHLERLGKPYANGYFGISIKCIKEFILPNIVNGFFDGFEKLQPIDKRLALKRVFPEIFN